MSTKNEARPRGRVLAFITNYFIPLSRTLISSFLDSIIFVLLIAIIGGVISYFGPYLMSPHEVIGYTMAQWCIERGSCDFTANYTSVALGLFLSAGIFLYLIFAALGHKKPSRSIYYDVRDAVHNAGPGGTTAKAIAGLTDLDVADVHEMLRYLHNDGEIDMIKLERAPMLYRWINRD